MGREKKTGYKSSSESGNVFFALFGAFAILGAVGATSMGIMSGPMKTMVVVSDRAVAESDIMANTKLSIMTVSQMDDQDCDKDGMIEPVPWDTAHVPTGGGLIPTMVPSLKLNDPWDTAYAYCVWDHGPEVKSGDCTDDANRLSGINTTTFPTANGEMYEAVAIISAGPDREFQTTCQDWATADANADGDLEDVGDTPLLNRPSTSDDLILSYTYAEAAIATSSNWQLQASTTDTAEIDDNVEVTGTTEVSGGVDVSQGGLVLPDESNSGTCNTANDNQLRRNTSVSPTVLEMCVGSTSTWTPISSDSEGEEGICIAGSISGNLSEVGSVTSTSLNGAIGLDVVDNYAYIANYDADALTIINIFDPANPFEVGTISNGNLNGATEIAVSGNYAYVVSFGSDSLTIIDISDPANPTQAGTISNGNLDEAVNVAISGNYAYVTSYRANALTIIDISNPASPSQVGTISNSNLSRAQGLALSGNYAYVTSRSTDALTIIDISNPASPSQVGTISSSNLDQAVNVALSGNYAYVAARDSDALTIIDVSDPANPSEAATISSSNLNAAYGIAVSGNYAYVASTTSNAVTIIDISDPTDPFEVTSISNSNLQAARDVAVDGPYVYVVSQTSDSLTIIDTGCDVAGATGTQVGFNAEYANCIANTGGPFADAGVFDTPGSAYEIWGDGTYIYVADALSGIRVYTHNGSAFTEITSIDTPGSASGIWGDDTYIYLAEGDAGGGTSAIRAYTFDGVTLTEAGALNTGGYAHDVWSDSNYIYVSDNTNVRAYSFDGSTFTEIAASPVTSNASGIWGDGTYIYVANSTAGGAVIAYTFNGSTFTEIASSPTGTDGFFDVWGDGTYIYASNLSEGIKAYTFNGTTFTEVASVNTPGNAVAAWGDGTHIYVADDTRVVAYTFDGATFTQIDIISAVTTARGVWGDGTHIYVADSGSGVRAYSGFECLAASSIYHSFGQCGWSETEPLTPVIANSGNAIIPSTTDLNGAFDIKVVGNYAYATGFDGSTFSVIDISDPLSPSVTATLQDNSRLQNAAQFQISGNYAFVSAGGGARITVVDISDPENPVFADSGNAFIEDTTRLLSPRALEIVGNYLYVVSYAGDSFTVLDISDPLNPVVADSGNAWLQDTTKLNGPFDLEIRDNYAYVSGYDGNSFTVLDISDPLNPVVADSGNAWIQDATKLNLASEFELVGNYALIHADTNGIATIDISNPLNPSIADNGNAIFDPDGFSSRGWLQVLNDEYAFATYAYDNAFIILDISDPLDIKIANGGNAIITDNTNLNVPANMAVVDNYVYTLAYSGDSLAVIDTGICDTNTATQATKVNFAANQKVTQSTTASNTLESFGTVLTYNSDEFGSQTGINFIVDGTPADTDTATASVTAMRMDDERGGLVFKTQDSSNEFGARAFLDDDGDLTVGLNSTPSEGRAKLQVGKTGFWSEKYNKGLLITKGNEEQSPPCAAATVTWGSGNCSADVEAGAWQNATIALSCSVTYHGSALFECSGSSWTFSSGTCTAMTGCDGTPDTFAFTDQTGAALSTQVVSNSVTLAGIDTSVTVTISGDGSPQFRINGGSWGTTGSAGVGDTIELRLTSGNSNGFTSSATVNVGNISDTWTVRTLSDCTAPWGPTVLHGNSITAYQAASVAFGGSCNSQTRTCNDGVLSGSYTHQSCSVSGPANCSNGSAIFYWSDWNTGYGGCGTYMPSMTHGQYRSLSSGGYIPKRCGQLHTTCNNGTYVVISPTSCQYCD